MDVGIEEGVEDGVDAARVFTKREFTKWPSPPKRELLTLATFEWQRAIRQTLTLGTSNLPEQHEHERTGMIRDLGNPGSSSLIRDNLRETGIRGAWGKTMRGVPIIVQGRERKGNITKGGSPFHWTKFCVLLGIH